MAMINYFSKYLVPLVYMIPAIIAFYIGFLLRKRLVRVTGGINYPRILFFLCMAEGVHNSYYFVATLLRNTNDILYETMMLPFPWLFVQGIIALSFVVFGFHFIRERDIELGDVREISEAARRYRELSLTDPLTNLNNIRSLKESIEKEKKRSAGKECPFTIMMIDLDQFKAYNDRNGHQAGDRLLAGVANAIRDSLRDHVDISYRYGGDEFLILFPETALGDAEAVAGRFTDSIKLISSEAITLSIGLVEIWPESSLTAEEIIQLADRVLYRAKKSGGNRVSLFTTS